MIYPVFKTIFKMYWNLNRLYQSWGHKDMRSWRMSAYLHLYALTICILPDKQWLSFSFTLILRPPKQSSFVNQCACYVFNVEFNHHLWSFSCSFTTIRFSCKRNNSFDVTRMVIIWSWKFVFQMWHKAISCLYWPYLFLTSLLTLFHIPNFFRVLYFNEAFTTTYALKYIKNQKAVRG